jgi:nicotinate (nicotinamide) nucleotide adenylyltransferase/ribosome silencing factor RsfS/YbeB/iojap
MLRLAIADDDKFDVTDVEIDRGGVSYTIDSLRRLRDGYGGFGGEDEVKWFFIVGADMFLSLGKWRGLESLMSEFGFVVGQRPGFKEDELAESAASFRAVYGTEIVFADDVWLDISSTDIRRRVSDGESIHGLTPDPVISYISGRGLYAGDRDAPARMAYAGYEENHRVRELLANTKFTGIDDICAFIRSKENPHRYEHTMRVLDMAVNLSRRFGADEDKAMIAALFHDMCKDCSKPGNDLAHATEAAGLMKSEYGIDDEDILNAVRYHTTGRAGMSRLELVIFLADTLEPSRSYEGVSRLRDLVYDDIKKGALEVLRELNRYIISNGIEPAEDSLDAIRWLEGETEHMLSEKNETDSDRISEKVMREKPDGGAEHISSDIGRSIDVARGIAKAIDDKRGRDIVILDISGQSSFADCFVNATATNTRMLATIEDEVGDVLEKYGLETKGKEGRPDSGWILVDGGDVIVNLFLEEQRAKYQIEKIWNDAKRVDV